MTLRSKTIIGIALIEALALGVLIISGLNWFKSSNETSLEVGSQNLVSVFAQASRDAVIATDLAYLDSFARSVVSEHKLAYIRIVKMASNLRFKVITQALTPMFVLSMQATVFMTWRKQSL
ncbi:hypothetical protein ACP5ZV_000922 [Vibrio parahaemolyticus]